MRAILLDIEGTTTSLSFVQQVLFPLSHKKMEEFVKENWTGDLVSTLLKEIGNVSPDETVQLLRSWIQADRKHTILKAIQGRIWKSSFESGEIHGHVYPDVPKNFQRWVKEGLRLFIYSSGSVEAQKLLFRYSNEGDLTPFISGYFDTLIGSKKDTDSYRRIAGQIGAEAWQALFLSDVAEELKAAAAVGMQVRQVVREDQEQKTFEYQIVRSFDEIRF